MLKKQKVETLKEMFKMAMVSHDFNKNFNLTFGNNGVIFRPKDEELKMFCIKTPLVAALQTIKPNGENFKLTEEGKMIFKEVFSGEDGVLTRSISTDIKNYKELQKNEILIKYIPKFYYYEVNTELDFIIMDYIEGEYIESMNPFNCNDPNEEMLAKIYRMFKNEGFTLIDRIEAIYDKKNKKCTIIDLGSFLKDHYN
ncbi:TPA: hypothetical protein ACGW48_004535 [Bacillus paranthracis]